MAIQSSMHPMTQHTGGHMPIAMEEYSKNAVKVTERWLFCCHEERRDSMYAKLDKLRADLKKAVAKRDAADAKVKQLEAKLKEEDAQLKN